MSHAAVPYLSWRTDGLDAPLARWGPAGKAVPARGRIEVPEVETKAIFITGPDGTLIDVVQQPGD